MKTSWCYCVLYTQYTPTGVFWQQGVLEWLHLPASRSKVITPYFDLVATLVAKGRSRALTLFGCEPPKIVVPYNNSQQQWLWTFSDSWQIAFAGYPGKILCHYPTDKFLQFYSQCSLIFPQVCVKTPLPSAYLAFTDGSASGIAAGVVNDQSFSFQTEERSAQRVELLAVQHVLSNWDFPLNLYSDSRYVVNLVQNLETAPLSFSDSSSIISLLLPLQQVLRHRFHSFFIGHIRAHSNLPGPLATGNSAADSLTRNIFPALSPVQQAESSHAIHHQNARSLRLQFHITREQARQIVKQCPACVSFLPQTVHLGVNPRGLQPAHVYQMDVTHFIPFGKLKFIHVTIDTFSHFLVASAHTGEAVKDVISHCLLVFSIIGPPKILKTDNGPAYTSKSFQSFCSQFQISHRTGIPYNPQGQGIVERSHAVLKNLLSKLKHDSNTVSFSKSPHDWLRHALYVLNFLTLDDNNCSAADRFWHPDHKACPEVIWKDTLSNQWHGPDPVLMWGRGHVCVFPRSSDSPIWVPERLVKHEQKQQTKSKLLDPEISSTASDDSYSSQTPVPAEQQT